MQYLQLRREQTAVGMDLTPDYARSLEHAGNCFSAWAGSKVVACAGVIMFWPGRGQVWALISEDIYAYGSLVHRYVRRYLLANPVTRLECIIDPRFPKSEEWARRLGFEKESRMARYGLHGQDMDMYVYTGKVRTWRK